jgi:hypothetical protein
MGKTPSAENEACQFQTNKKAEVFFLCFVQHCGGFSAQPKWPTIMPEGYTNNKSSV